MEFPTVPNIEDWFARPGGEREVVLPVNESLDTKRLVISMVRFTMNDKGMVIADAGKTEVRISNTIESEDQLPTGELWYDVRRYSGITIC